jgi:cytochrome c oxidase subunit 2
MVPRRLRRYLACWAVPGALCVWESGSVGGGAAAAAQGSPEPRVIEVVAQRFVFEPPEIQATEGERIRLVVRSGDGLHGIEIKQFRVSKEIPRGKEPVTIEFTADAVGRFPILCSVYCGDGHDDMKGALVVNARTPAQP